ncbi:MAG: pantoate--beta-alanine ligase [Nitrospinae bacterium]|nr:pantoate--beta-alanine ligase [Nitrospinota bacterium]
MKIIRSVSAMKKWGELNGGDCGFVPTLGALHDGHVSLIRRARKENRKVAVSVFVNPLQFGRRQYLLYPRDIKGDAEIALKAGADVLFAPSARDIYNPGFEGRIILPQLFRTLQSQRLEWHFKGVLVVVMKLFQIVRPGRAYFGLKDPHQLALIEKMAADFDVPVVIRKCPTVRERGGLARSSRNALLTADERRAARVIYKALMIGKNELKKAGVARALAEMKKTISSEKTARIEHMEIVDPLTLSPLDGRSKEALIFAAVSIGGKRLTDNVRFRLAR